VLPYAVSAIDLLPFGVVWLFIYYEDRTKLHEK